MNYNFGFQNFIYIAPFKTNLQSVSQQQNKTKIKCIINLTLWGTSSNPLE